MDRSLLTDAIIQHTIRKWNGTFHTQYRYTNKETISWIKSAWDAAQNELQFNGTWDNLVRYYVAHPPIPDLTSALSFMRNDLSRTHGAEYTGVINYTLMGWIPSCVAVAELKKLAAGEDEPEEETPVEATPVREETKTMGQTVSTQNEQAIALLAEVMANTIKGVGMDKLEAEISDSLKSKVDKYIADTYGAITRKTKLVIGDKTKEVKGVVHEKFGEVLNFVANDEPVFLTGAAGTGKNYLCKQIAEVLGIPFYFTNAVTQEYKLTGYTDANGVFHESQFYKAFKNGGLFMLDEIDASIPEVLIILNAAIANRYFDFPAPIGYVEAHPNFRVIAAGNTFGNGADYDYVGRSQLDAASLDRFGLVHIDYDPRIEEAVALGDSELLGFCRAFRKACKNAGIRTVVSYRAISRMAKMTGAYDDKSKLIASCLTKGLTKQDLKTVQDKVAGFGAYSTGFAKLC